MITSGGAGIDTSAKAKLARAATVAAAAVVTVATGGLALPIAMPVAAAAIDAQVAANRTEER